MPTRSPAPRHAALLASVHIVVAALSALPAFAQSALTGTSSGCNAGGLQQHSAPPMQWTLEGVACTYVPPVVRGDREFARNGPRITARAWLEPNGDRTEVFARLQMHAAETGGDRTVFSGVSQRQAAFRIYTAPRGYRVFTVKPQGRDTVWYIDGGASPQRVPLAAVHDRRPPSSNLRQNKEWDWWHPRTSRAGVVQEWTIFGRGPGEDWGRTRVEVRFEPVVIVLEKVLR